MNCFKFRKSHVIYDFSTFLNSRVDSRISFQRQCGTHTKNIVKKIIQLTQVNAAWCLAHYWPIKLMMLAKFFMFHNISNQIK